MPKKTARSVSPEEDDIRRLKTLARRLIGFLEEEVEEPFPDESGVAEQRQKQCEWLFGARNSLAAALLMLIEIADKLAQAGSEQPAAAVPEAKLTPADVELIKEFIRRSEPPASH